MTAEKKKQAQLLTLLMVVLSAVGFYEYQSLFPSAPAAASSPAAKAVRATQLLPSASNARIRQDLLDEKNSQGAVGKRNVFQYYVPPPPPKPAPPPPPPPPPARPLQTTNPVPTTPPAPATKLTDFQFDGVGIVAKPGKLVASIDDKTNHYYVSEGDYILGRYRINRVTETSVEIEDMDLNQRRTYTRVTKIG